MNLQIPTQLEGLHTGRLPVQMDPIFVAPVSMGFAMHGNQPFIHKDPKYHLGSRLPSTAKHTHRIQLQFLKQSS